MEWSDKTMDALRRWLKSDGWSNRHPIDEPKFHDFVWAVWEDHKSLWDEQLARDIMKLEARKLHPGFDDVIEKVVYERRSEATQILDFLTHLHKKGKI